MILGETVSPREAMPCTVLVTNQAWHRRILGAGKDLKSLKLNAYAHFIISFWREFHPESAPTEDSQRAEWHGDLAEHTSYLAVLRLMKDRRDRGGLVQGTMSTCDETLTATDCSFFQSGEPGGPADAGAVSPFVKFTHLSWWYIW